MMSYTQQDAWEEEAYDRMVEEILESNRGDVIGEFVSERSASYYRKHPDLAATAESVVGEATRLLDFSPAASLVFSCAAIEIIQRDVLLKPVAMGMVYDEEAGAMMVELVIRNHHFKKLLFKILEQYGLDLKATRRQTGSDDLWSEMQKVQKARNMVVHNGTKIQVMEAQVALEIGKFLLQQTYPDLRNQITGD